MLSSPTVVILGAGASVDFGMPIGSGLATQIANLTQLKYEDTTVTGGDALIGEALLKSGLTPADAATTGNALSEALPFFRSIDDCLASHRADAGMVRAAKLGIARTIASAEEASFLHKLEDGLAEDRLVATRMLQKTWMLPFMQKLATGVEPRRAERVFDQLTIVNFNYDRCLEIGLLTLVQSALRLDIARAAEALCALKVYRPYGSLGPLKPIANDGNAFGAADGDLASMASGLRVYTEDLGDRPDLADMAVAMAEAEKIVFLGFGFHDQNMRLLSRSGRGNPSRRIYATAAGESVPRIGTFRASIQNHIGNNMEIHASDCTQLLNNYYLEL